MDFEHRAGRERMDEGRGREQDVLALHDREPELEQFSGLPGSLLGAVVGQGRRRRPRVDDGHSRRRHHRRGRRHVHHSGRPDVPPSVRPAHRQRAGLQRLRARRHGHDGLLPVVQPQLRGRRLLQQLLAAHRRARQLRRAGVVEARPGDAVQLHADAPAPAAQQQRLEQPEPKRDARPRARRTTRLGARLPQLQSTALELVRPPEPDRADDDRAHRELGTARLAPASPDVRPGQDELPRDRVLPAGHDRPGAVGQHGSNRCDLSRAAESSPMDRGLLGLDRPEPERESALGVLGGDAAQRAHLSRVLRGRRGSGREQSEPGGRCRDEDRGRAARRADFARLLRAGAAGLARPCLRDGGRPDRRQLGVRFRLLARRLPEGVPVVADLRGGLLQSRFRGPGQAPLRVGQGGQLAATLLRGSHLHHGAGGRAGHPGEHARALVLRKPEPEGGNGRRVGDRV